MKQYYKALSSYRPWTECSISLFFKQLYSVNIQDDQSLALLKKTFCTKKRENMALIENELPQLGMFLMTLSLD